jgi:SPP1 family predicted phage head-tail adaptor
MNAGALRHRVTILSPVRTESATGGRAPTSWATVATVWASLTQQAAHEQTEGKQTVHRVTHEVRLRYRDDVTADCRLSFRGRTFAISSVANVDELGAELRLIAVEVT